MKLGFFLAVLALQLTFSSSVSLDWNSSKNNDKSYKIVCYYTNWAQYRPKPGTYFPEDIDPKLCTHIIFAFAKINSNSELEAFEWNDESTDWAPGMYKRTIDLKKKNKDLKFLVAVGGWNHGSLPFSNMVTDDTKRRNFIAKTVEFLKKNSFDGLDLDWEYPANRDTEDRPDDKLYFTILCKELHTAFKPYNYILTAAVAAGAKYINSAYETSEIHKYLDFINLMAYDLHGGWDNVTGHNAPLYKHEFDQDQTLNVDYAIKTWLSNVPAEKLVLGLSAYGRSFKLKEGFESCPLTDTPVSGAGSDGKYSREAGFLTYYEICEKIYTNNWKYVWNDQQKVPYAYSSEILSSSSQPIEWVGFDDVKSIEIKIKYIIDNNLGGGMIWSLDMDDFTGTFCNQGKYPLLSAVNHYLNPKAKIKMPQANLIWSASKSDKKESNKEEPIYESSFITFPSDAKISSSGFFSSNNVFGLIQNNVMQVYKFCQCKNGTHKINSNKDLADKYSFTVDCNIKKVYSNSAVPTDTDVQVKKDEKIKPNPKTTEHENDKNNDKNTIWSIFGINSPSVVNYQTVTLPTIMYPTNELIYQDKGIINRNEKLKIVCYLSNMFNTRNGYGNLREEHLEKIVHICTHIIYSYAKIDSHNYDKLEPIDTQNLESYKIVTNFKKINPNLKVLLSVGSYKEGSMPLLKISQSPIKRRDFIRNSIIFLKRHNFDGLELNWNLRNIDSSLFVESFKKQNIKSRFTKIVEHLYEAYKPFNLILSAMVSGLNDVADSSYEINKLNSYLDFVTIMMYDFYEIPLKFRYTSHHNPLFAAKDNSLDSATKYWIKNGFQNEKILIGVDLYARTFTTFKSITELGCTVKKEGEAGFYTMIPGVLSYFEVCQILYEKNWIRKWIDEQMVPYAYDQNDQIVFYEDSESISFKSMYVKTNNLGGISLFSLDNDDFSGTFCMQGKYPLINSVKENFDDPI